MVKTDSGWEITLNAPGLPRLDNGRFYQGWLRNADGVLVPIGTFNEGTDVVLWSGVSPDAFSTLTITQEAGRRQPGLIRSAGAGGDRGRSEIASTRRI